LLDLRVAALCERGMLAQTGRAGTAYVATDAGRSAVCQGLGVTKPPTWKALQNVVLPALALGQDPSKESVRAALGNADKLRGAVLRQKHDLKLPDNATLARAADALVWRALGVETGEKLTLQKVQLMMLAKILGFTPKQGLAAARSQLAAAALGAPSPRPDVIRRELVRGWLAQGDKPAGAVDDGFIAQVNAAAAAVGADGRVGARKVFIASAWQAYSAAPGNAALGLAEFKERLVTAHRAGAVVLHRLDYVTGLDRALVEQSEATYLNATFHLLETAASAGEACP
jgi:hypothetical protein